MSTRAEAWSRFTARISHEAAKAGSQIFCLLLGVLLSACGAQTPKQASFKPRAEHVVLCVWDGMRPDFITPAGTPVLHALIQRGTLFANNHSQYVTTTEVNGTVLATGVFPARSGIVANREFRREIDPLRSIATESVVAIRKGDELSGGKYLGVPTIAEMLQRAGVRTAIAGSKPVTLLHNRNFGLNGQTASPILFAGKCYPPLLMPEITAVLGPFPELSPTDVLEEDVKPNTAQNAWTTRALTEVFWKEGVPKFSLLWLNDPDFAQHMTAPGSPAALAGASDSDRNLGLV
ncbi:MAG: alkaline phosphatase family protein, partial [Verrucomicrobiota bacterium]